MFIGTARTLRLNVVEAIRHSSASDASYLRVFIYEGCAHVGTGLASLSRGLISRIVIIVILVTPSGNEVNPHQRQDRTGAPVIH